MTTFPDLDTFNREVHHEALKLPIRGHTYKFTGELSIERGLQINRMREESRRIRNARAVASAMLRAKLDREPTAEELSDQLEADGFAPRESSLEVMSDFDELEMYLDLIGEENRKALQGNGVTYNVMVHVGSTLFAWHVAGPDAARAVWKNAGVDPRPPVEGSASSSPPTTSRNGSTPKKLSSSKPRRSRGATTSSTGTPSKRTSTASTKSTSRTRKS